ncbi:MAG TPA: SDR family NAD(P)-dependent oxidoreductase, partial [Stellaceae bacterium]|nr:SDR family NAD(P)-dependent oxidoreductase [Stellaceae bacterium]
LRGRGAVVTGGARGIGYACAERLNASGAKVSLWDMDGAALVDAAKTLGGAHSVSVDITDANSVAAAAKAAGAALGKVDILVNNAGITGPNRKTWEFTPEEWRRVIDVDLTGAFLCSRALVPGMRTRRYGRIVNMASVAGKEGNPNAAAYSAAKAGLIGLTKSLGKELATENIMVNCVTPAAAETDLFKQMTEEHIAYMRSKIPMNRFVQPSEIAALVAWLCSEECGFSTGGVFDISGGRATY